MPPANRLTAILASYGRFHRDPRNRLTHYFGVPAIIYFVLMRTDIERQLGQHALT
jgi:uncharacterized membrane protein YGL010W